jgi:outer membrane protein W
LSKNFIISLTITSFLLPNKKYIYMKKIFTLAVVTIISASAFSQTQKGNWLVGGSAGFSSQSQSGASGNITELSITPTAGYFINNNLAVGASLNFGSQKSGSTVTTFGIGPMVRYYFAELGKNAKLYGQGEFAYASVTSSGVTNSGTGWALQAGPAFFLNKNVAIETTLRYGSVKPQNSNSVNTFGVNVGFQIHL